MADPDNAPEELQAPVDQAPTAQDEPESPSENAAPDDETSEEQAPDEEAPKKARANRQGYVSRLNAKLDKQQAEIEQLRQAQEQSRQPAATPPKPEDFSDYEQYLEALVDHRTESRLAGYREDTKREAEQRRHEEVQRRLHDKWEDAVETAYDKYEDFEAIALSDKVRITETMSIAIKEADEPAEVAYWLGKNLKSADRIASMSATRQIAEIGRIEEKLKATVEPRPAPPPPVRRGRTSGATSSNTLNDNMSVDAWMKARNKQAGRS